MDEEVTKGTLEFCSVCGNLMENPEVGSDFSCLACGKKHSLLSISFGFQPFDPCWLQKAPNNHNCQSCQRKQGLAWELHPKRTEKARSRGRGQAESGGNQEQNSTTMRQSSLQLKWGLLHHSSNEIRWWRSHSLLHLRQMRVRNSSTSSHLVDSFQWADSTSQFTTKREKAKGKSQSSQEDSHKNCKC